MFSPLRDELDRWCDAGMQARLWLRDDDAIKPTDALLQLDDLSQRHGIPMLLAVVPQAATGQLGDLIRSRPLLDAAVHGFRHRNHAPAGQKSIELGGERPAADICAELASSLERLHDLCGDAATTILVPPWNRIAPEVVGQLPALGFNVLSTFGSADEARGTTGLQQINTHLDIIDWKGSRGGRDPEWLVRELVKLLEASRGADGDPIGVLTHHLVHDQIAWEFLEGIFEATSGHPGVAWFRAGDLVAA